MFEGVGLLGTPLVGELAMGMAEMRCRLPCSAGRRSRTAPIRMRGRPHALRVLAVFALVSWVGRTGFQMLGLIEFGLAERVLTSLIWPFAKGAAIGVLFLAFGDAMCGLPRATAALAFGLGVFGANWAIFMAFVPMVFPDALADTALRVGLDILLVTGAAFLAGLQRRQAAG